MINTAVVLAAGRGTRMKQLTADQPKHVIAVNGRPWLFYLLDNLQAAGFKKLLVVIGYQRAVIDKQLREWTGLPLEIIDQSAAVPPGHYGTWCPILAVKQPLAPEPFVAVSGDNLYSPNDLARMRQADNVNLVAGIVHQHPERYGVLMPGVGEWLAKIVEKPTNFIGSLINTGLYTFTSEIFTVAPQVGLSPRGEYELTDAVNLLAAEQKVKIKPLQDYWLDFTKPEDVDTVEQFINSGKL